MFKSIVTLLACVRDEQRASCGVYPNKRPSNVSAITATSNKAATAFHSNGETGPGTRELHQPSRVGLSLSDDGTT